MRDPTITRRRLLELSALTASWAAMGLFGCRRRESRRQDDAPVASTEEISVSPTQIMPAVFLPHGGGPWPFVNRSLFGDATMWEQMEHYLRGLGERLAGRPEAVLVISAHWEEPQPTLMTAAAPPMLYDYYGFPEDAYEVQWPAPGAPDLAAEVEGLLRADGLDVGRDATRGFDHGTFVPLKLAYPEADMPTLQLSLKAGLDPAEHMRIGRALAPLRERGVFIVGSGMSYHNMGGFRSAMQGDPKPLADSKAFDDWLAESMAASPDERERRLLQWEQAPAARASHPREEHLLPLHVVAGAALDSPASLPYRDIVMGVHASAVQFG